VSVSKDLPLVSVVIPAHNHARYLDEAIESVLNQDYPNVELIVLDDGSTDNTREVLKKYTGRFYWETQENIGQSATLNKGWKMSKGDVLAYLSSDDALLPHAISTSVEHLMANPDAVLTYCDFNQIDPNSRFIRKVKTLEMSYLDMVAKFVCLPGPGAFFLRSAFEATGGWDEKMRRAADLEYWLRLGLRGRFLRIPEVLALWRIHEESSSFAEGAEWKSEEYVYAISKFYKAQHLPSEVGTVKNEAFSNAYITTARSHLTSKRYRKGLVNLLRGLYLHPRNLSFRTLKIIAYGLFNQVGHRLLRRLIEFPAKRLRAGMS
jgi:glycosyltransferase involved in cell wall biosynthesis